MNRMEYQQFLQKKELVVENKGFEPVLDLNENLFDWQKDKVSNFKHGKEFK